MRTIERISMYSGQPIPRPGTGRRLSLRANAGPFDLPIRTERDSALQCTLFKFHLVDVSASGTDSLERYGLDPSEVGYGGLKLRQLLVCYRREVGTHQIVVRVARPQTFDQFAKCRFTSRAAVWSLNGLAEAAAASAIRFASTSSSRFATISRPFWCNVS